MMIDNDTIGAILAVTSAIISNFGVNVQKKSHIQDDLKLVSNQTSYYQRPLWWLGLVLVVLGSVGDFAAFGFATQALVASVGGGTTMIANVFIAYFFNNEPLYGTDIAGVFNIILGTGIIAAITKPDAVYTLAELEARFVKPKFLVYLAVVILCMLSMLATIKGSLANKLKNKLRWTEARQKRLMRNFEKRFLSLEERIEFLESALVSQHNTSTTTSTTRTAKKNEKKEKLQRIDDIMEGHASRDRVPYYYAICSGVVGAISVLLAKCTALMLKLTISGSNQFTHTTTWAFMTGMAIALVVQTHLLNMATKLGDTMTVFPIFQAFWISFSVIGGIVFYESDSTFDDKTWGLYTLSLVCVAIGVTLLTRHEVKKHANLSGVRTSSFEMPIDDLQQMLKEDNNAADSSSLLLPLIE